MVERIADLCLAHFLCKFDPRSKKRLTRDVAREVAETVYSRTRVDEFMDAGLEKLQQTLVSEFNERSKDGRPLRYQIADDGGLGTIVSGYKHKKKGVEIRFQNALHKTTAPEFERLAAVILRILGCDKIYSTPTSHDQGVDAFGTRALLPATAYGVTHTLTWIAQAKHFQAAHVTTGHVRELAGSTTLLIAKVFSTVDDRYQELQLRLYAPTAVVLVTTEEIPTTVRRLAERSGIFVLASSDLYYLLRPRLTTLSVTAIRALLRRECKSIPVLG